MRTPSPSLVHVLFAAACGLSATLAFGQDGRVVPSADYQQRLKGFWLGQCIADWTGLRTEGARQTAPFLTDADWGQPFGGPFPLDFVTGGNPWHADDDTDIEYVYLHEMDQAGHAALSPDEIRNAWLAHIQGHIRHLFRIERRGR